MEGGGGEAVEGVARFAAGEEIAAERVAGAELEVPHAVGPGFHLGPDGLAGSRLRPDRTEAEGKGIVVVLAAQGLGRAGVVDEGDAQALGEALLEGGIISDPGQKIGVGQFGVPSAGVAVQGDRCGRGYSRSRWRRCGLGRLRSFASDERVQAQGQRGQQGDDRDFFEDSSEIDFHKAVRRRRRTIGDRRHRPPSMVYRPRHGKGPARLYARPFRGAEVGEEKRSEKKGRWEVNGCRLATCPNFDKESGSGQWRGWGNGSRGVSRNII